MEHVTVEGELVGIELIPLPGGRWDWTWRSETGVSGRNSDNFAHSKGQAFEDARSAAAYELKLHKR